MNETVDIREILNDVTQWQIVDVRSPGEFSDGHIPGAVNVPLFSDEERAVVGTLYKQVSPDAAMKAGLKIAGEKMLQYLHAGQSLLTEKDKQIVIHCWRGGKRSQAIQWLFNFSGIKSQRLEGGYKSYRNSLHDYFAATSFDIHILGGYTGSGKTEILKEIESRGHQVIDLEQLAHHKGSAFGSIGEPEQPTNEQFENNLYTAFLKLDPSKPIWMENESKNIGKVYLPESLWAKMRESVLYHIEVDEHVRLARAIQYYSSPADLDTLKHSFDKIKKRLGGLDYKNAVEALDQDDLKTAASIALKYYDKSYAFQLANWPKEQVIHLKGCNNPLEAAGILIQNINHNILSIS